MMEDNSDGFTQQLRLDDEGNVVAGRELLELVYGELRRLANWKLNQERPGQTLTPTALVHEAWLKLMGRAENGRSSEIFVSCHLEISILVKLETQDASSVS